MVTCALPLLTLVIYYDDTPSNSLALQLCKALAHLHKSCASLNAVELFFELALLKEFQWTGLCCNAAVHTDVLCSVCIC